MKHHALPVRHALWAALLTAGGLSLLPATPCRADGEKLQVDADFPGGNIVVDKIDGDNVHLHQDLRDTAGDWFYWYFRVRGAQGRTLTFHFTKGNPIGVRGPAVSTDGGKSWQWLGAQAVRGASFQYAFPADAADVRFCFAFPYLEHNLRDVPRAAREEPAPEGRDALQDAARAATWSCSASAGSTASASIASP